MERRRHLRLVVRNDFPLIDTKTVSTPPAEGHDTEDGDQQNAHQTLPDDLDDVAKMAARRSFRWSEATEDARQKYPGLDDDDKDPDPAC